MKFIADEGSDMGRVESEGKMLEVIPVIETASGRPMMLPPAIWHVENWVLGFNNDHPMATPMSFWQNVKTTIPGSTLACPVRLTFMVRILEDGEMPNGVPVGHIDAAAVKELIQAVRMAPDVYDGSR